MSSFGASGPSAVPAGAKGPRRATSRTHSAGCFRKRIPAHSSKARGGLGAGSQISRPFHPALTRRQCDPSQVSLLLCFCRPGTVLTDLRLNFIQSSQTSGAGTCPWPHLIDGETKALGRISLLSRRSYNRPNPPAPEAELFCICRPANPDSVGFSAWRGKEPAPGRHLPPTAAPMPTILGPGKLSGRRNGPVPSYFSYLICSFCLKAEDNPPPPPKFLKFQKFSNKPPAKRHGISTT